MKKGRPYYYVRETGRVKGKTKVLSQVYLGSPEKILQMVADAKTSTIPRKIQSQEFGALWLAHLIEKSIGIAGLVDDVISQPAYKDKPSVGEYFLYAIYNRMIDSCSKRAMPGWYKGTAIQHIRPVDINALTSQLFWENWNHVSTEQLRQIAKELLLRVSLVEPTSSDCFMFDTTNYYTFMASDTPSDLAQRGKNKEGRNWLRQIGVALAVSRDKRIPLFYREYAGNRHDSKLFLQIIDELFGSLKKHAGKHARITMVFDKGMNSEDNIAEIDAREDINFITTYSTYFSEDLIHVHLSKFQPVDNPKNRKLHKKGRDDDRLLAWRTTGEYWEKERTVIVTYNPLTATKQRYNFDKKMIRLQEIVQEFKTKVNKQMPQWRNKKKIKVRFEEACAQLHIPSDIYSFEFFEHKGGLRLNCKKNHYRIGRYIDRFGKNIIVTDNTDWDTDEIVNASLERWTVEDGFRQSKDSDLVSMMPVRHWTDSKISCHIFTCIAALSLLRLVELKLRQTGLDLTAKTAMKQLHRLHSCLVWLPGKKLPERIIEEPDHTQEQILKAFGWKIAGGVLQKLNG